VRCRLFSEKHVRHVFGITPTLLANDVAADRVFSVPVEDGAYYPAFLFDPRVSRQQLARVIRELGGIAARCKWTFFSQRRDSLGRDTPLRALAKGRVNGVLEAAAAFAAR
jgi:hypothetical protein